MVVIDYYPRDYRLRARGHAGSGDPGRDLVCAGVSALVLTLRENLLALEGQGKLSLKVLAAELGAAQFWCRPEAGEEQAVAGVFETVVRGMKLLERLFGDFVVVRKHG